ncbi:hypothetical protein [Seonamhaeicola sp.]|uniref:hypothetical protein n=1 Tax=Seonamhaeicola sp. TaxID=1912245 RepID=UPI003562CCE6
MSHKEKAGKISEACNDIYKIVLGEYKSSNVIAYQMSKKTAIPIIEKVCLKHELNAAAVTRIIYGI